MSHDRRNFLKQVSAGAAAAAAVTAATKQSVEAQSVTSSGLNLVVPVRPTEQIKISMELDGSFVGWLQSVEGGNARSEVVAEKLGPEHVQKKHIGAVKYQDISVTCGYEMGKAFYEWIKASFDGATGNRKNGAIIACDFNRNVLSVLDFKNALITELGMPTLDATSKDAAKMTLKFKPEYTRKALGGGKFTAPDSPTTPTAKKWLPANFRLKIDGLEEACSRVNKIEAITIKQNVVENPVGEFRDYEQEATSVELPNLVITLPEANSKAVYSWHEDFVIKGNSDDGSERSATLEYLTQDLKTTLFEFKFGHVGIFNCETEKITSGATSDVRRTKAEMYCENITLQFPQYFA